MSSASGRTGTVFIWLILTFVIVGAPASFASADDLDSSRERLNRIQTQIEETLKGLRGKKSESGALAQDLDQLNAEVRRIGRLAKKSNRQLSDLTGKLEAKRRALKDIEQSKRSTETQIRQRLVVLYKTGEVGLVRALLSESQSPRDIMEKYEFLSRMVRHDRELLSTYRQKSQEYSAALDELEGLRKQQSELVLRRRKEQDTLTRAQKEKKVLLAAVKEDEELLESMLKDLRAKAARLNELVKKLETEQTQPYTENLGGLQPQKGHLLWPVHGQLKVGFGTSRHGDLGTLIESHGFDIEADVGTPVNAVAAGKVIFANSLRGYGKLIIVDHGQKYYTLYAHMERFAKKLGDFVAAGEVIAYSGYEGRDAVYFEIRKGGKPLDPADWLTPR